MPDITPIALRGLMVPSQYTIWEAQTTADEANLVAGVPEAPAGSTMVLEASGAQDSIVEVKTLKGGLAGQRAQLGWKLDTASEYYGHDAFATLTDFQILGFPGVLSITARWYNPTSISLDNATQLVTYRYKTSALDQIRVQAMGPNDLALGSAVVVYTSNSLLGTSGGTAKHPSLAQLQDGSVLLVFWVEYAGSTMAQLYVYRSTDSGANWSKISTDAASSSINTSSFTLEGTSFAQSNGELLLITRGTLSTGTNKSAFLQHASSDQGVSFDEVGDPTSREGLGHARCLALPSGFGVAYVSAVAALDMALISSPYLAVENAATAGAATRVTTDTVAVISANKYVDISLDACSDEAGNIYVLSRNNATTGYWSSYISIDGGNSFNTAAANLYTAGFSETWQDISAHVARGRMYVYHNWARSGGEALALSILGGYSTRPLLPTSKGGDIYTGRVNWAASYEAAFSPPSSSSVWTNTGTVPATVEQIATGLRMFTSSAIGWYNDLVSSIDDGILCRFRCVCTADASIAPSNHHRYVSLATQTSTSNYEVEVRLRETLLEVYDVAGGASVANVTLTNATTNGVECIIELSGNKVSAWFREAGIDNKTWAEVTINSTVVDGGGDPATRNRIQWGHNIIPSSGQIDTIWQYVHATGNQGAHMHDYTTPADLRGRIFPPSTTRLELLKGLYISSRDGVTREGDTYNIEPRSEYPLARVQYTTSPSPQVQWRSNTTTAQRIALKIDSNDTEYNTLNDLLAVHLSGSNIRTYDIQGYDTGAASWVTIQTVDLAASPLTVTFDRKGDTLTVTGSTNPYVFYNECADWYIQLGGDDPGIVRRIVTNSEGSLGARAGSKQAVLRLANVKNTDPTTGTAKIWPNSSTSVLSLNGARYAAYAIRIPTHPIADPEYRIGHISIGSVFVFAPQYSRGRKLEQVANIETIEQADGVQRIRKLGKSRRRGQIAWADPVDVSKFYPNDGTVEPDYYRGSTGGKSVANYGDGPFSLMGLTARLAEIVEPVVYLPHMGVLPSASGIRVMRFRAEHMLALVPNGVQIDHVLGDELEGQAIGGELFRVSTLNLSEVI